MSIDATDFAGGGSTSDQIKIGSIFAQKLASLDRHPSTTPHALRLSVGMPLYNAERYLRQTLDSLISQTFHDFELIISDNGSTDNTDKICREYAERDSRIRYYRNKENRGAAWNFNRVLELADGEYFKWAAYDDPLAPQFFERCLVALDQNPSAVLSFSRLLDIDDEGRPLMEKSSQSCHIEQTTLRMRAIIPLGYMCEEVFGIIRTDVLRKTPGIAPYSSSDQNLLMELALYGSFVEVPEVLFFHRCHKESSCILIPDERKRYLWFDTSASPRLKFPVWKQFYEFMASIRRGPLTIGERFNCYKHMLWWINRYKRKLFLDLYYPLKSFVIIILDGSFPFVRRAYCALTGSMHKKSCC